MNEKKYGLFSLSNMCIGGAIGAGVFALVGAGIGITGRSAAFAMVLGTIMYAFTYIPILFLSAAIPLQGGSYSQSAILLPKILVFSRIFRYPCILNRCFRSASCHTKKCHR